MANSAKTVQKVVGLALIVAALVLGLFGVLELLDDMWKDTARYAGDMWESVKADPDAATQPASRRVAAEPEGSLAFVKIGGAVPLLIGGIVVTILGFRKPRVPAP